jgi:hypothetical protein
VGKLTVVHATLAHGEDVSAKLRFAGFAEIAFS